MNSFAEGPAAGRPEELRNMVRAMAAIDKTPLAQQRWWLVVNALESLFLASNPVDRRARRYSVMRYLVGKDSTKELTEGESDALVNWALTPAAQVDAELILQKVAEERGQMKLL